MNTKIRVFDSGEDCFSDRYTVIISNDVFGMSNNACSPNGFNQYIGTIGLDLSEENLLQVIGEEKTPLRTLPSEVLEAIINRLLMYHLFS